MSNQDRSLPLERLDYLAKQGWIKAQLHRRFHVEIGLRVHVEEGVGHGPPCVGLGRLGIAPNGLVVVRQSSLVIFGGCGGRDPAAVELGVLGVDENGFREVLQGLHNLSLLLIGETPAVVRLRKFGLDQDGCVELRDGLVKLSLSLELKPGIVAGGGLLLRGHPTAGATANRGRQPHQKYRDY